MSFLDWMNMNMIIDIACIVFLSAMAWKFRNIEKNNKLVRSDLDLVMRNPQAAKRLLKEREQ